MPIRVRRGLSAVRALSGAAIVAAAVFVAAESAQAAVPLGGLTIAVSPAGDKLVAGGDTRTLLVLDPQTLAVKDRIWIGTTIVGLAFDKAGATLAVEDTSGAVLLHARPTNNEPKVSSRDAPKDLRGLAREEFILKNDGKVSDFAVFDVGSAKTLTHKTTFFSISGGITVLFDGDNVTVTNYKNVNAKIAPDGAVKMFALQNSYNYGIGVAPDHALIMTGGLRNFSLTKTGTLAGVTGQLDKLPGWPEYFKGFTATPGGGAIYGATTGCRVLRIGPDGKVLAVEPVK